MALRIIPDIVENQRICDLLETSSAFDAARLMAERNVGAVVISDESCRLVGIVTERDIVQKVSAAGLDLKKITLARIMTRNPDTLSPDDSPSDALERMQEHHYRHLPVLEGEHVVGMVSVRDLYAAAMNTMQKSLAANEDFLRRLVY